MPERVAFGGVAQGRRAFRESADAQEIVFSEEQIVRTRFERNIGAERASFERRRDPFARTDVHDVEFASGFAGEKSGSCDGLDFGDDRARFKECRDVLAARFGDPLGQAFGDFLALGVDRDGQTESRGLPACLRRASGRRRGETPASRNRTGML